MTIRVVLADDHPVIRCGIRHLLTQAGDIEVVDEADDGARAIELAERWQPDVMLVDVEMGDMSGVEVARHLARREGRRIPLLVLSAYATDDYVAEALDAGAAGYLLKDEAEAFIRDAVRAVAGGQEGWLSRPVAAKLLELRRRQRRSAACPLGRREQEVLRQVASGRSNKQVAAALRISIHTAGNHLTNIYAKLGVHSRVEAVMWAQQNGLLENAAQRRPGAT